MSKKQKNQLVSCYSPKIELNDMKINIRRDREILNSLRKIRQNCSYDIGTSLDAAIGRVMYDLTIYKKRIKYLKKEYKIGK